jgi:hypothetical protein
MESYMDRLRTLLKRASTGRNIRICAEYQRRYARAYCMGDFLAANHWSRLMDVCCYYQKHNR